MATNTIDPVTGIVIPTPGEEPGEQYAVDISNGMLTLAHLTHTGEANQDGYQIPAAGLNIDADVSCQNNNLTNLRSIRLTEQSSTLSGVGDLDCVYDVNGNLFFNNGSGTPVQITAGAVLNSGSASGYVVTTTSINLTIPSNAIYNFVGVHSGASAITITLPLAADVPDGYHYVIKDIDGYASTNNITIRTAGDSMDGSTKAVMTTNYQAAIFVGDGVSNWGVLPFDKTSYNDGDTLVFTGNVSNETEIVMDGYSAIILNSNSVLAAEAGSIITVANGGTMFMSGLLEVNKNGATDGELRIVSNGLLNVDSNGVANINTGANLNIVSGGTETVESGATFIVNSGATYTTAQFANFPSGVSRTLINPCNLGQPLGGTWTYGLQAIYSGATGSSFAIPLMRVHQGATLASIVVTFQVGSSHSGVPVNRPNLSIVRYTFGSELSPVTLSSSDPQYFPNPGSGSAYYDSGNIQQITYTCNRNNVIDDSQYNYVLSITDESGTNSLSGNAYFTVQLNFTTISSQQWSM